MDRFTSAVDWKRKIVCGYTFFVFPYPRLFFCAFSKKLKASRKKLKAHFAQKSKKLNLSEANSHFTKKPQGISYPNYGFSWGSHVLGHFY